MTAEQIQPGRDGSLADAVAAAIDASQNWVEKRDRGEPVMAEVDDIPFGTP